MAKPIPLPAYPPAILPEPPAQLGETGRELWHDTLTEFDISDAPSLTVLEQACAALDRANSLRQQIAATGEVIPLAGGGMNGNPLIVAELAARGLVARLLGRLGVLDSETKRGPGRPPKTLGW